MLLAPSGAIVLTDWIRRGGSSPFITPVRPAVVPIKSQPKAKLTAPVKPKPKAELTVTKPSKPMITLDNDDYGRY
jgi:hypothetical protein